MAPTVDMVEIKEGIILVIILVACEIVLERNAAAIEER